MKATWTHPSLRKTKTVSKFGEDLSFSFLLQVSAYLSHEVVKRKILTTVIIPLLVRTTAFSFFQQIQCLFRNFGNGGDHMREKPGYFQANLCYILCSEVKLALIIWLLEWFKMRNFAHKSNQPYCTLLGLIELWELFSFFPNGRAKAKAFHTWTCIMSSVWGTMNWKQPRVAPYWKLEHNSSEPSYLTRCKNEDKNISTSPLEVWR